ncbi:MAG: hypothetical protein ACRD3W_07345, partial [Terriglobales bacterium]
MVERFGDGLGQLLVTFGELQLAIDERKRELERLSKQVSATAGEPFAHTVGALAQSLSGVRLASIIFDTSGRCFFFNIEAVRLLGTNLLSGKLHDDKVLLHPETGAECAEADLPWLRAAH